MIHVLIEYSRSKGRTIRFREFDDSERHLANAERVRREMELRDDDDIEIVLLGATQVEDLHRTHSRYFKTPSEMLEGFAAAVSAAHP